MTKHRTTKIETLRSMLARPEGASLEVICQTMGWQAHSARAALSGLRKAGHTITRAPAGNGKAGGSVSPLIFTNISSRCHRHCGQERRRSALSVVR